MVVVEGTITTEKKEHEITLSHSLSFTDTVQRMITNATVSISTSDTLILLSEKADGKYVTSFNFAGTRDENYRLDISLVDGNSYYADCYLYPSMIVDGVLARQVASGYDIYMKAHSTGKGAACLINIYVNDSLITQKLVDKVLMTKGGFNEKIFYVPQSMITKNTSWITVEMFSIPYVMYQYLSDIKNETIWSVEPFRETPANVRTNISKGGLGFFLASEVTRHQIFVAKTEKQAL
jgi:hypothetical protein